ncbi:transposase IS116/IS110/IS902 family protein [Orientia tsutsugamushi str. UT144]|uniref:Transposase IS116/IS110/IS902 family protein n=1 Tax=Orientia tsutsugamushi str. UT144 TaxID=1441384 RepID=A0A0F3RKU4_ORITS|nr:transposase IS116/IS110/IS902 family protein [Orientia tsutsugamushi str. UT144]
MHIEFLETQIKEIEQLINDHIKNNKDLHNKAMLLESIPGIGAKTQAVVLAFLADIEKFSSAKQVVAFVVLILSIVNLAVPCGVLVESLELVIQIYVSLLYACYVCLKT